MKMSTFIQQNREKILVEWERFAGTLFPDLNPKLLRNHAAELLTAMVEDMETPQTNTEQVTKSKGKNISHVHDIREYGQVHALHRLETGFTLFQLVLEYRYLRAFILRMWGKNSRRG